MRKNIYISDEDVLLWERAKKLVDGGHIASMSKLALQGFEKEVERLEEVKRLEELNKK